MDTVVILVKGQFSPEALKSIQNRDSKFSNWSSSRSQRFSSDWQNCGLRICLQDSLSGMTISTTPKLIGYLRLQVSIPRLFYGVNSICMTELDSTKAWIKIEEKIREVADVQPTTAKLNRYDFAIQFPCDSESLMSCYRHATTRLMHKEPIAYLSVDDNRKTKGLQWIGKNLSICFYDKVREITDTTKRQVHGEPGKVLRIEVSFRRRKMIERYFSLGVLRPWVVPSVPQAWHVVRAVLMTLLTPFKEKLDNYSEAGLIAWLDHLKFVLPNGLTSLEWKLQSRSGKRGREFRKKVQAHTLQLTESADLSKILPTSAPPRGIDILKDGTLKQHEPQLFESFDNPLALEELVVERRVYRSNYEKEKDDDEWHLYDVD